MHITQDTAVTLDYRITDLQGKPLDAGTTAYLHGGYDNLFAQAEAALEGKTVGDKVALALSAAEAFGARDEALARSIPKSEFPPGVKVGGQLQGAGPNGPVVYRVVKTRGPEVLRDANPPLAGQDIRLAATVKGVRAATAEEIAHGHVHGAHGHHH